MTFGDNNGNLKTEIMERSEDGTFSWTVVDANFPFTDGDSMMEFSLVSIETLEPLEEYVLLIGGMQYSDGLDSVYKFNGTWSPFGQLKRTRFGHRSIFWMEAVYVFGGEYEWDSFQRVNADKAKTEVWNLKISPDHFNTTEELPELYDWRHPHLLVIPSAYFT